MSHAPPPFPEGRPRRFRATVHGTVFGDRERLLLDLGEGDALRLVPDPPGQGTPWVWVHRPSGDPVGHLPPEICGWLWPWLAGGGRAHAVAVHVGSAEEASWRRLVVEVTCPE